MTSKYQFRIPIYRPIDKDMLLKLLKDLESGVILEFSSTFIVSCEDLKLDIIAPGYIDSKESKVLKLSNLQRREFISKALKILSEDMELTVLTVSMNEYTASLPQFPV